MFTTPFPCLHPSPPGEALAATAIEDIIDIEKKILDVGFNDGYKNIDTSGIEHVIEKGGAEATSRPKTDTFAEHRTIV